MKLPFMRERQDRAADDGPALHATDAGYLLKPTQPDLQAFAIQLEDEGLAQPTESGWLLTWDCLYRAIGKSEFASALAELGLPEIVTARPALASAGTLTDRDFGIAVQEWLNESGQRTGYRVERAWPLLATDTGPRLMNSASWRVLEAVIAFLQRPDAEKSDLAHRQTWGRIRQLALDAHADLSDFLRRSVVVTPERLKLNLRRANVAGIKVMEVAPTFEGAPDGWLDAFDRQESVPERYDIPTRDGVVQVLVTAPVRNVLREVKRLDRRRVAGARAEAFVHNPFAALGQSAAEALDASQIEEALVASGAVGDRFTAAIERDATGYPTRIAILVERTTADASAPYASATHEFGSTQEAEAFTAAIRRNHEAGLQLCSWGDYEFELQGDTEDELRSLEEAIEIRKTQPRALVRYADIFDISAYSSRIEGFGVQKPYYSPYIAKKTDDEGWIPENLAHHIAFVPEGSKEPVAVPLSPELLEKLDSRLKEAEADGASVVRLAGLDQPIPVIEARHILEAFREARKAAAEGKLDPSKQRSTVPGQQQRAAALIKANIQHIDYEERRRDALRPVSFESVSPAWLRPTMALKQHQVEGLAWLKHLYSLSPDDCRGVVLADDMGLGKTLQLLSLIAAVFEANPQEHPALVVAPVSLLENWKEETERFFLDGTLPILVAYGAGLEALRVPRADIDQQLVGEGLVRFLKPGWRGNAQLVLTTYETLRDMEFSFARETWSIMVCDEAQRIKNPNALVTRAAKKQKVRFKIACTGTPVENTLADLWCLFDFVQPGLLGALNEFGQRYRRPIEARTDEEKARVEELRRKVEPQILRRTKAEVAKDLPRKIEDRACRQLMLSQVQRALYASAVQQFRQRQEAASPFRNHLGLLHYLRVLCTDPRRHNQKAIRPQPLEEYRTAAPKIDWLLRTLTDIASSQEKAIVFCEFKDIQRLLAHYIRETFGITPDIINGDTTASATATESRQKRIRRFQEQPGFGVLILSPVAVGFGVNIQAANHVIHYTRTWNPAKEDQATDRAYRIGQTRDVHVYCPVVRADDFTTFDVKLDQLLELKRGLAKDMLNGTGDLAPTDFNLDQLVPGGAEALQDEAVSLDDALCMAPQYFEALVAALLRKQGNAFVYRTPDVGDHGVDVVSIDGGRGHLIQCKTSAADGRELSWEAVKDVVTGEAYYRMVHPGIRFEKACATNQRFNANAHEKAALNNVVLWEQAWLQQQLAQFRVTHLEVDRMLVSRMEEAA